MGQDASTSGAGSEVLDELWEVIDARRRERPEGSYVVQLLSGGNDRIADKVREEAAELIEAAASGDARHTAHEAADLLFHVFVLLAAAEVPASSVYAELAGRFGTGGLAEKAARAGGGGAGPEESGSC